MSNMKCPTCNTYLHKMSVKGAWVCSTHESKDDLYGSKELWQELIRTRKALNFAISTLTVISEGCVIEHSVVGHEDDNKIKLAKIALDKIKTALEQKEE